MATAPLPPHERPRALWPLIGRAIGVASSLRCLILAAAGVAVLRAGWATLGKGFGTAPWSLTGSAGGPGALFEGINRGSFAQYSGLIPTPIGRILAPFLAFFAPDGSLGDRFHAGLAAGWVLLVWGVFGAAIVRIAVTTTADSGRVGLVGGFRFAAVRIGSLIAAPAAALAVAILISLAGAAVGLLDQLGSFGVAAATALAFVPLLVGLINAVILLGLALAWPLMIATVVTEGEDFFDAISRSYSYVRQRFLPYLTYAAIATGFGILGATIFSIFVRSALGLADWSISLGAPSDVGHRFLDPDSIERSGIPAIGYAASGMVDLVVSAWSYSFLWAAVGVIYLILRRDVDGAEIHDIYQVAEELEPFVPAEPASDTPGSTSIVEPS